MRQHRRPVRRRIGNDNRVLVAHDFAQAARHAFFRDHFGDLVMPRARVRRVVLHVNAIERTDVHAKLAARAIVHDDFRLRDLARLDALDEIAELILDARDRAVDRAHAAINAAFRVDDVQLFRLAADGVDGTFQLANSAADARICNEIRHANLSLWFCPNLRDPL